MINWVILLTHLKQYLAPLLHKFTLFDHSVLLCMGINVTINRITITLNTYTRVMRYTKNSIILSGMIILSCACNSESREVI